MTPTNIILRLAVVSDAESLSKFMNRLADENLDTVSGIRPTPAKEAEFIEKAAKSGRAFLLLALDVDEVIGVLDLWGGEGPLNRHAGQLGTSVLAPYRRKGIGRRLLDSAIHEAKNWSEFCRIELEVVPWNEPAIRLYESVGFTREGTKRKTAILGGQPSDLIQMALVW
jgi:RimJ/RimL family protein N-acetyltransferase